MESISADKKQVLSRAIANHDEGRKGKSLPAVPVLQKKASETQPVHPNNDLIVNPAPEEKDPIQMVNYVSGGPVYMDDDDPTSELLDDNFDDTIKGSLTQPTADGTVETAVNTSLNQDVVLWRSTTGASKAAIVAANSAGGAAADVNAAVPGHALQQAQIAVGGQAPEYTASTDVTGFSWRHWLVVVRINTRYITRGSGSESGWICSSAAPVVVLDTVDRTLGLPEPAAFGAA